MKRLSAVLFTMIILATVACAPNIATLPPSPAPTTVGAVAATVPATVDAASNSSAPTIKTASGLQYQDLVVGTGTEAKAGMTISANYIGKLTDGTIFDQSNGKPFSFTLGAGQVIAGWDEGVVGMKVGGKRVLNIPANLGYGAQGSGPIPPNAALIFEIDLVSAQ